MKDQVEPVDWMRIMKWKKAILFMIIIITFLSFRTNTYTYERPPITLIVLDIASPSGQPILRCLSCQTKIVSSVMGESMATGWNFLLDTKIT